MVTRLVVLSWPSPQATSRPPAARRPCAPVAGWWWWPRRCRARPARRRGGERSPSGGRAERRQGTKAADDDIDQVSDYNVSWISHLKKSVRSWLELCWVGGGEGDPVTMEALGGCRLFWCLTNFQNMEALRGGYLFWLFMACWSFWFGLLVRFPEPQWVGEPD